jgi:hypothetical protein
MAMLGRALVSLCSLRSVPVLGFVTGAVVTRGFELALRDLAAPAVAHDLAKAEARAAALVLFLLLGQLVRLNGLVLLFLELSARAVLQGLAVAERCAEALILLFLLGQGMSGLGRMA